MTEDKKTLGELLSDPRIRKIAPDAIRNRDLSKEEAWNKTPAQLRDEHFFFGDIGRGFRRLFDAADTGDGYYPLYSEAECAEDESRRNVNMVWFPSDAPEADERPFILLVPGGGFVNVWNLTEGWPVAAQFNSEGYHVFIPGVSHGETAGDVPDISVCQPETGRCRFCVRRECTGGYGRR